MTSETRQLRLSRPKRLVFGACAVLLSVGVPLAALLAVDVYLHGRYERAAGFNIWGYRGPVVKGKRAGEFRVAMFGGSTTYGYGVTWDEAIPARLEQALAAKAVHPISVVNLAYNNEGAYADAFTMRDYQYLQYDLAILYSGYNDLPGNPRAPNLAVFRHDSPVFRRTGYLPIFPIVFKEKAAAMTHGGNPATASTDNAKTVFRPGLATRTTAQVLTAAAAVEQSLEQQLSRISSERPRRTADAQVSECKPAWEQYCASVRTAIEYALGHHQQVVVVTPPYEVGPTLRARHMEQQSEMAKMVATRFGSDSRVLYVNLGDAVDLNDPTLSFDRMHLAAEGNRRIAAALVAPVTTMSERRRSVHE